jgi:hypothetical protein
MTIPLSGQGRPLPSDFPYRGQWMIEGRMFLYVPDEPRTGDPAAPQFTVHLNQMQGNWSFGFDSTQLATALGISPDELFEANRSLRLTLERVDADAPTGEEAHAKRYTFRVGDNEGSLTIEVLTHAGRA